MNSFASGLILGLLVGEGHFGGDGKQPQVTLRMHIRHEPLFRWLVQEVPGSRLPWVGGLAEEESLRASFGIVTSRATWSLEEFLRLASPFVSPGGVALAMKGPHIDTELLGLDKHLQNIGFYLKRRYPYALSFGGEKREAVVFSKVSRHT